MRIAIFSTKPYDRRFLTDANARAGHELIFFEPRLNGDTAAMAQGFPAVCVFVNDTLNAHVLRTLADGGTRLIALRCAGFNNVDLAAAEQLGLTVVHVPAYSPYAVAEHTVALMLALNRRIHRAFNRVREGNFALDGLLGFDMHKKTVGVIGTGRIGALVARSVAGFGCRVLAYDVNVNPDCTAIGVEYVPLEQLFPQSDIVTLHCPLVPATHHLINADAVARMKPGVMIINTGRGALVDTPAVIDGLKSGRIGYLGLDVYEEEADLFFEDLSGHVLHDDVFARLLTFPNVIITGHQGFFTREALANIAETTLANINEFERDAPLSHRVSAQRLVK